MTEALEHLFSPIALGSRELKNRVVLTPHAHVVSSLWASEEEAAGHIAYWKARTDAAWVDGVSAHVRNRIVPGFDPTGVGAQVNGHFRAPFFHDRVSALAETLHAAGTVLTVQMILQGGMPGAPSAVLSGPTEHQVPHPLTPGDIDYFIDEYAFSAAQAVAAGADGIELHLNHDDILEWFVSPLTNRRTDAFGGDADRRLEFPRRILRAIRAEVGADALVGIRFSLREDEPGGYDVAAGAQIAKMLADSTAIDWVSTTAGTPWGNPSYVQAQHHGAAEWAPLTAAIRAAVDVPVVYTGRVTTPEVADRLIADGHADIVGFARAVLADAEMLSKARSGRHDEIRPCVAGNECLSRRIVENTPFSCAVNPVAGREARPVAAPPTAPKRILVVGGGPAGMEAAAQLAERGHDVELWEATDRLGGQLRSAARAPGFEDYRRYLEWQERRIEASPVRLHLNRRADAADATGFDTVLVATGASPRIPEIAGVTLPGVVTAQDVLDGIVDVPMGRILVIAEDDHLPPLSVADHLSTGGGRAVTAVFGTARPAPLVSRYSLGSILGRLDAAGVELLCSLAVSRIERVGDGLAVRARNVYSQRERELGVFDGIVLSCSAVPETALAEQLTGAHPDVHVLGDAFAPRRLVWATRQAYDLAQAI